MSRRNGRPEVDELGIWVLGLIVGFAFLFVMFRIAGLSGPNQRERPPRWLLVVGIVMMAGGFVLLVIYVGSHLLPGVNSSLPFLQLGRPTDVVAGISLVTLASSVLALGTCSLLVRLPR